METDKYVVPFEKSLVNKFITLSSKDKGHIYVNKIYCCIFLNLKLCKIFLFLKSGTLSEEALHYFSKLLEMDASSGPGIIGFGIKCLQEKKYKEAIKSLTEGKCIKGSISTL